jgi:hypothetical protein
MKPILRFSSVLVGLLLVSSSLLLASGPAGVICIVDKVVFEPSDAAAQRIQIWGAFSVATSTTNVFGPARAGYMYFSLPANATSAEIARKEWADLKSVAGTGTGVGFGSAWTNNNGKIRDAKDKVNSPDAYVIGSGVVRIQGNQSIPGVGSSNGISGVMTAGGILDQVRQALKAAKVRGK